MNRGRHTEPVERPRSDTFVLAALVLIVACGMVWSAVALFTYATRAGVDPRLAWILFVCLDGVYAGASRIWLSRVPYHRYVRVAAALMTLAALVGSSIANVAEHGPFGAVPPASAAALLVLVELVQRSNAQREAEHRDAAVEAERVAAERAERAARKTARVATPRAASPPAAAGRVARNSGPAPAEERRQWVRDECAAGRYPTGADVDRRFGPPRTGARIVRDVNTELPQEDFAVAAAAAATNGNGASEAARRGGRP